MSITVILNGYKRGNQLTEQLNAIKGGTIKPDEILLWYNNPNDDNLINYDVMSSIPTAFCNYNFGVWARFAFAFNAQSEYVCIFDDDTIPGSKWLENCLETMKTHEGLLGTVGLLYLNPLPPDQSSYYEHYLSKIKVKKDLTDDQKYKYMKEIRKLDRYTSWFHKDLISLTALNQKIQNCENKEKEWKKDSFGNHVDFKKDPFLYKQIASGSHQYSEKYNHNKFARLANAPFFGKHFQDQTDYTKIREDLEKQSRSRAPPQ